MIYIHELIWSSQTADKVFPFHFIDEKIKGQLCWVICERLYSQEMAELEIQFSYDLSKT